MFRFVVVIGFLVSGCAASADAGDSPATDQEATEVREGHLGAQPTTPAKARFCSAGDFELAESNEGTVVRVGNKTTLLRVGLEEARRQLGEDPTLYRAVQDGASPREDYASLEARLRCRENQEPATAIPCPSCAGHAPELAKVAERAAGR